MIRSGPSWASAKIGCADRQSRIGSAEWRPSMAAHGSLSSVGPGLHLLNQTERIVADRVDREPGDTGGLVGLDPVPDPTLVADHGGAREVFVGNQRGGFVLLAVEVEVLDLLRLLLV